MIENGIARFGIAEKIDQRNAINGRSGKRAHDKVEIRGRKTRPTICPDHREPSMSSGYASGKPVSVSSQMTMSMLTDAKMKWRKGWDLNPRWVAPRSISS